MELANELFRQLQYFDHIAVRVAAICEHTARRHDQWLRVELHSRRNQPVIFTPAIVNLETDVAEAGLGHGSRPLNPPHGRRGKFKNLQPRIRKAHHNQPPAARAQAQPFRQGLAVLVPAERVQELAMTQIDIETGQPAQIFRCDARVVKTHDHERILTESFRALEVKK